MCKIRAPKLYWADIATSENINTWNEFTHFEKGVPIKKEYTFDIYPIIHSNMSNETT